MVRVRLTLMALMMLLTLMLPLASNFLVVRFRCFLSFRCVVVFDFHFHFRFRFRFRSRSRFRFRFRFHLRLGRPLALVVSFASSRIIHAESLDDCMGIRCI